MDTDCTGSCKSNYHTITTAPVQYKDNYHGNKESWAKDTKICKEDSRQCILWFILGISTYGMLTMGNILYTGKKKEKEKREGGIKFFKWNVNYHKN
jgi:hypothetical protein